MISKTKKPLFASSLYIALSLCALAVVIIGAYSAINELFKEDSKKTTISNPIIDLELPSSQKPATDKNIQTEKPEQNNETPVINNNSSDTPTSGTPEKTERIFMFPVNSTEVLKEFKIDELVYSATMNDYRTHAGIDIACNQGSAVYAMTDGVIESIHPDPLMGQTIIINHGDGLKSIYQNLALEIPEGLVAGVEVHAGDLIAAVGDTAIIECGEKSHLHFAVIQNDSPVNPKDFVN